MQSNSVTESVQIEGKESTYRIAKLLSRKYKQHYMVYLSHKYDAWDFVPEFKASEELAAIVLTKLINIISYQVFDTIYRRTFEFDK